MACAWAGVGGYGTSMLLSYFVGQKKYKIDYPLKDIAVYTLAAAVLFAGMVYANKYLGTWAAIGVNTVLILLFCFVCAYLSSKKIKKISVRELMTE